MKSPLISIIIPVYNAESYIKKCIDSILSQKYNNFEIIIVDDGSTDSSLSIIKKYETKNIKIVSKQNEGVSIARNTGLEKATGKYVFFVDSDDYLEKDCLESAIKYMLDKNLDILKFSYVKELNKYKRQNKFTVPTNKVYQQTNYKQLYKYILSTNDFCNIWNCIMKKEILKDIKFDTKITFGEDFIFFVEAFLKSKRIMFINEVFYHYTVNNNSITHKFNFFKNKKILLDGLYVNKKISKLISYDYKKIWKNKSILLDNLDNCIYNSNYREFKNYLKIITEIMNNNEYSFTIDSHSKLNKLLEGKKISYLIEKGKLTIKKIAKRIYGGK